MSSDSTLYFTAVEDMFKELLTIEVDDSLPDNKEGSGSGSDTETPKRCVKLRKHKLFAQDSGGFVISRRSPKLESKINLELHLSPGRQRELRAEELLRLRKDRAVKERQKPPQRRLTLRI
ncbi:uncharacterized protein LOC110176270 [Drosophila serrata]|uniref:uncharacterized protein LOC110176270 n=1 Tax=Drosophila serrata TaxID=7274 RepID=UPI000A1D20E9|nr:uncharacterized protein LOC110176270 [Drosophila serrata]